MTRSDETERSGTSTPIAKPLFTYEQFNATSDKGDGPAIPIADKVPRVVPAASPTRVQSRALELDRVAKTGIEQAKQVPLAVPTVTTKLKFPPTAKTIGPSRAEVLSARQAASVKSCDRIGDLEVNIVGSNKDLTGVTRYAIEVSGPHSSHVVQRGYQEFRKLHREMFGMDMQESLASKPQAPDMPSRSSCFSFMSRKFKATRQERLHGVVVGALAAAADVDLIGCPPPLHQFLELDKLVMASADPFQDVFLQSHCSDMISTSASFTRTYSSFTSPTEGVIESPECRLAGLEKLNGRTPFSLTASAVAARLVAPPVSEELQRSYEIYDNQPRNFGNFFIDGFWLYDGHCIAHVADSHVHWLADHLFTELRPISFGHWSTEIDGHRFQLKARRPVHSVQLVWSDGTIWDRQEFKNDEPVNKSTIQEVCKDTIQNTCSDCSDCSDAESELDEDLIKLLGDFGRHTQNLNKLMTKAQGMKQKKKRRKRPKGGGTEDPAMLPFADRRARFEDNGL